MFSFWCFASLFSSFIFLLNCRSTFFFPQNRLNFRYSQIAPKSLKSDLGVFLAPILMSLGAHLGTIFLKISWHPGHCYLATSILQNAHFNLSSPPILGPNFQLQFNVLGVPVFGHPFFVIVPRWCPKSRFWDPLRNPARAKIAKNFEFHHYGGASLRTPVFTNP